MTSSDCVVIVGGGITGLTAARELVRDLGAQGVLLLERNATLGGAVQTERVAGFVIEGGPDSFVTFKPAARELCRDLGIAARLQGTREDRRGSFIKRQGRLFPMPPGLTGLVPSRLTPLLTTPLLSWRGKLRAGGELFVPRRRDGADESLAAFTTRRFGREVYDWLVEPLLAGIHAADGQRLSVSATYPNLTETEQRHGGMLRQMLGKPAREPTGGSPFLAPVGGVAEIVEALERSIPPGVVRTGEAVARVEQSENGYRVEAATGARYEARAVILATPAHVAGELVRPLDAGLAQMLAEIPFVSTATVSLAYRSTDVDTAFRGSGYLSPRAEGGPVVACTWASNKFAGRAPEGAELLRVFIGRDGVDDVVSQDDVRLTALAQAELQRTLGITASPTLVRVSRWPRAIPQYTVGHLDRVDAIDRRLEAHPGLILAGASYRGAGLPDCITQGRDAARRTRLALEEVDDATAQPSTL